MMCCLTKTHTHETNEKQRIQWQHMRCARKQSLMVAVRIVIHNQIGCEGVVTGKYISFLKSKMIFTARTEE